METSLRLRETRGSESEALRESCSSRIDVGCALRVVARARTVRSLRGATTWKHAAVRRTAGAGNDVSLTWPAVAGGRPYDRPSATPRRLCSTRSRKGSIGVKLPTFPDSPEPHVGLDWIAVLVERAE